MTQPANITVSRSKAELAVVWDDGHVSAYSFTLLRNSCPCAECRGGHENMGKLPGPEIYALPSDDTPATRLLAIEPVGAYGITIKWEDGHHYGIYTWQFLRALCPCPDCRRQVSYGG